MRTATTNRLLALALVLLGVALAAGGIHVGDTDDAPGAALLGILLLVGALALAVRLASREDGRKG